MANDRLGRARASPGILVADENPDDRELLEHLAANAGLSVTSVADGRAAWMHLRQGGFALAIINLSIPIVSGYELVSRLEKVADRPVVIVLTTKATRVGPLDAKVVIAIAQKPIDAEMLRGLLAHLAGLRELSSRKKREPLSIDPKAARGSDGDGDDEKKH